jgi:hypothetical protein
MLLKALLEAARRAEAKLASEKSAKPPSEKDVSKHQVYPHLLPVSQIASMHSHPLTQDERFTSARSGWGRAGDRSSGDSVEVKILQRAAEKLAVSQSADAPSTAGTARGASGGGKGAKASTPRDPKRSDFDHSAALKGPSLSPKLHSAVIVDGSGHGKVPPKSPNLGPAAASTVVAAAAAAAEGTPSNRGKGKRKDAGGKGKVDSEDLPLPFDT